VIGVSVDENDDATIAPLDCHASGNVFDSGVTDGSAGHGIAFVGAYAAGSPPTVVQAATGSIVGNIVTRYGTSTNGQDGAIYAYATKGLVVQGNRVEEPSPNGICFSFLNYDFSITGNTILDAWTDSALSGPLAGGGCHVNLIDGYCTGLISGNVFAAGSKTATHKNDNAVRIVNVASDGSVIEIATTNRHACSTYVLDAGSKKATPPTP
jgi:hypothetical protein